MKIKNFFNFKRKKITITTSSVVSNRVISRRNKILNISMIGLASTISLGMIGGTAASI
jgi:hypothetical protein